MQFQKRSGMTEIPTEAIAERASIGKLRATEKDVEAAFGKERIERTYRPDGSYSWRVKLRQNDGHGKLTRDGGKVRELMMPFARADSERSARMQAGMPKVALRDGSGSVQYSSPERAASDCHRNGWHSADRIVGLLATGVTGDFCPDCDRLRSWCECHG